MSQFQQGDLVNHIYSRKLRYSDGTVLDVKPEEKGFPEWVKVKFEDMATPYYCLARNLRLVSRREEAV